MGHGGGTFDISLLSIDDCVSWRSWIPLVIVLLSLGSRLDSNNNRDRQSSCMHDRLDR